MASVACGRPTDARRAASTPPVRVEVRLREWAIDLPDTVPAGTVTFAVRDVGHDDHAFRIHGHGIDAATRVLEPDLAATLTVTLAPGRYGVECPVKEPEEREDHARLGMRRTLVVVRR
ncbi:MAG: hypothetical protein ACJ8J0_08890 [Longimicrobiaceae bacterium]